MLKISSDINIQPSASELTSRVPIIFSVAPMLKLTDRHCRFFLRQLSRCALLYTEMVTTSALLHGTGDYLTYHDEEHPLALQLGGNQPTELAKCAKMAQQMGYDEVNLNVGCPSTRVHNGRFGACLMADKELVGDCVAAMRDAVSVSLPITVKTRIGIDTQDSYEFLYDFIDTCATKGGCKKFIIHARKAWLKVLSPHENREIPPLDYEKVYLLKRDFPALKIVLNGGITTLQEARNHLHWLDGVMIGRAVYHNPSMLTRVDSELFSEGNSLPTQAAAINAMLPYIEHELLRGTNLIHITRHMLGLFKGMPGAKHWRRYLSEYANRPGADTNVLIKALSYIQHEKCC